MESIKIHGEEDASSPNHSTPGGENQKKLSKLINKPSRKRDNNVNEDSDKSDSEDSPGAEINAKLEENTPTGPPKKPSRLFKAMEEEKYPFSIFRIESYIEKNLKGNKFYAGLCVYAALGFLLIMAPSTLGLLLRREKIPSIFVSISKQPSISGMQETFKVSVFLGVMFITYLCLWVSGGETTYFIIFLFKLMNKKITKDTRVLLFIFNDTQELIVLCTFFLFGIFQCNLFLENYVIFKSPVQGYELVGAVSFCFFILLVMFIGEKFFLKMAVAYCGNNVFSPRIGDLNLKMTIVRRLSSYAEAIEIGNLSILAGEIDAGIEITDSFLIHYADFSIKSIHYCEALIETIYSRLGCTTITKTHVREAFGGQWQDIWKFLQNQMGSKTTEDEERDEVEFDDLVSLTKLMYTERIDLKRTLQDRDNLLAKLDFILIVVASALTIVLITPVIGFDPVKYMAGIIPIIMSSGWLFSDIIKSVLNNFLFLLHEHPFDVGDKINTKDEELVVLRIDLMYTTFTSTGGTICYIPNKELINEKIFNIKRSDIQIEIVTVSVDNELEIDDINTLKTKIQDILKSKDLITKKNIHIQDYEIDNSKTKITFKIEYYCNFQDPEPKYNRRYKPMEIIHGVIKTSGFTYIEQKTHSSI
ncbi:hypothetical protein NEDG_01553 [Nematocida displodere]|uniref:Mechanosensitive ion channel MscS domain-containing protein n=1 Tax=Nematocida displodere TaxID=1805483 RepID=A0A177EE72_9MICR|nr:hypothetical protein NEDG_01553 [Nematocida displodere]